MNVLSIGLFCTFVNKYGKLIKQTYKYVDN